METERIEKEMFEFVQMDKSIHDKKFDTKPIGYFKDAWIRFRKNKSSVIGGVIILFLILFAIFAPIISKYDYTDQNSSKYTVTDGHYAYALPKSTAFAWLGWDGTSRKDINQSDYDITRAKALEYNSKDKVGKHDPITREYEAYTQDTGEKRFVVQVDSYLNVGYEYVNVSAGEYACLQAYQEQANIQVIYPLMQYVYGSDDADIWYCLTDKAMEQLAVADYRNLSDATKGIDTTAKLDANNNFVPLYMGTDGEHDNKYYSLRIDGDNGKFTAKKLQVEGGGVNYHVKRDAQGNPIYDVKENQWYRYALPNQSGYRIRVNYYEYYRYLKTKVTYSGEGDYKVIDRSISDEDFVALMDKFNFDLNSGFYAQFIFGALSDGKDIFSQLGSGARLSFLLAVAVSLINLTIGAIYGAIEGYYGGTTDIVMERVSDILSGVPFIVVATLFKLHLAKIVGPLVSLLFAFVLTGWIGMAARVRMQFYRFKNQEYILSARTLGAKDRRIMFKHIFPNAIGTIITGSILSIPGVIFSESSLSYLNIINLETSGFTSIGTLLSAATSAKFTLYPFIMFFPAIFISLLMISFNLFGNGLRDAFNPSLRGTEE